MALRTYHFDNSSALAEAEEQVELLTEAFASGDAGIIANALKLVARAQGLVNADHTLF